MSGKTNTTVLRSEITRLTSSDDGINNYLSNFNLPTLQFNTLNVNRISGSTKRAAGVSATIGVCPAGQLHALPYICLLYTSH